MTEWEKLKVAELKEECKSRSIPLTGLKLKQHFIDKLVEYEANSQDATPAETSQAKDEIENIAERTHGAIEVTDKEPDHVAQNSTALHHDKTEEDKMEDLVDDLPLTVEADKSLPSDRPTALKIEDSQASNAEEDTEMPIAKTRRESEQIQKNDIMVPQPEQLDVKDDAADAERRSVETKDIANGRSESVAAEEVKVETNGSSTDTIAEERKVEKNYISETMPAEQMSVEDAQEKLKEGLKQSEPEETKMVDRNGQIEEDDQVDRKRKRRSLSPPIDAKEIHKKAKSAQGEAIVTKTNKKSRSSSPQLQTTKTEQPSQSKLQSPEPELPSVEAPLHSPTRSLYLSNFKRPLHVPTLRAHLVSLSGTVDPIEFFNINNIRSHAFVTFITESAATRVRSRMHNTKFPDEDLREKIFVDFVPDDKVEEWVEMETTSSRTGRNSNAKLEVAYIPENGSHKAVFRDASMSTNQPRGSITSGIPDRSQPPRSPIQQRPPPPKQTREPRNEGTGFSGLDELFESTTSKPKLYFKKVSQDIIDDRIDMIKDLYPDRGVSGDPGMKRYTFEKDGRKEDWVDNGPEFGHGQKGQDRLLGVGLGGRGRGFGYRGRGRGRGGYRGDFRGGFRPDRDDYRR